VRQIQNGGSEMEEELDFRKMRFKRLHLTYWAIDEPLITALVMSMITELVLVSVIIYNGGQMLFPLQQLGEIIFVTMMAVLVLVQGSNRMGAYGYREERTMIYGRMKTTGEALAFVATVAAAAVVLSGGEHVELHTVDGSFSCMLPFSSPLAAMIILMHLLITGGSFVWITLAGAMDWRNYVDLRDQLDMQIGFEEYVRLATKYAKK